MTKMVNQRIFLENLNRNAMDYEQKSRGLSRPHDVSVACDYSRSTSPNRLLLG